MVLRTRKIVLKNGSRYIPIRIGTLKRSVASTISVFRQFEWFSTNTLGRKWYREPEK